MSELLPDNLELARHSAESRSAASCATLKPPKKRELLEDWKGLITWSVCFNTFTAIIAKSTQGSVKSCWRTTLPSSAMIGCSGNMWKRSLALIGRFCTPCSIPSLSSVSVWRLQPARSAWALTTPSWSVPLQPWSLSRSLYAVDPWRILDSLGQPGSVFVEIPSREHRLLLQGPSVSHSMKANVSEGQCFWHPKPCDREHKCIRCGGDHRMIDCKATLVPGS